MKPRETIVLPSEDPSVIKVASEVLSNGGLVAFPTDTVYGVGAAVEDPCALADLYRAKGRTREKPIPVLISSREHVRLLTAEVPESAWKLIEAFWPGPLTLVLKKAEGISELLSQGGKIGIRMPDHPVARRLLDRVGPLGVTSANLSGEASLCEADGVFRSLKGRIDLILDGGPSPGGIPSTVLGFEGTDWEILRDGPITWDRIRQVLETASF